MKKILLALGGCTLLGLVACNSGTTSTPNNNTLYSLNSPQLASGASAPGGCVIENSTSNVINCTHSDVGYTSAFNYTFTSSTPGSFLDLETAQSNAASSGLSNVTLTQSNGGSCSQNSTTGSYTCNFTIQGAAGTNTGTFQIPLNGSLGAQNYLTVNVN